MKILRFVAFAMALATAIGFMLTARPATAQDSLPPRQTPWTVSKIKGSPEPPLPYKATRVFAGVELDRPIEAIWLPLANKWAASHAVGKWVTFENDPETAVAKPFFETSDVFKSKARNSYAIAFHPDQEEHPWCFVTFLSEPKSSQGNHLARLKVLDPTVPTIDEDSLEILLSWDSRGHSGGSMQFGADGMLYLSIGDGQRPYPPDADNTGQDLSDLEASILRIDVSNPTADQLYRIPDDNPFVGQPNVRGEIWAFGFRNPWKIAFDPNSGDLLAADVGWEMREIIHRVKRGRNHGWSLMEGTQSVKKQEPKIAITPPLFEHTHVDSRSISGGQFWQSDRIPDLEGAYIYGDWMTGKVWALKHEGDKVLWQKELVDTPRQVIGFMLDPAGEVLILAYDGTILRLDPNTQTQGSDAFPKKLSQTGLFADVVNQEPAVGVIEYEVSAHHWADDTQSRQWIAVPDSQQLGLYAKDIWFTGDTAGRFEFPADTVLAKTVSYLANRADPNSRQRLETQLLHRYEDDWRAYNYVWNESQTDAILQDDVAVERKLVIQDASASDGVIQQTWRHASRSECLLCHIWAAGTAHAFWPEQLNISIGNENQLAQLTRKGLFRENISAKSPPASPYDPHASLQDRARSYLALNCSTCHRPQGGGTANFNFDLTKSLVENNYIDAVPAQGGFGMDDARVVASGDPLRSVMLYRALKSGRGHMPQFGSNVIDMQGIQLLRDWITTLPSENNSSEQIKIVIGQMVASPDATKEIESLLRTTSGAMALSLVCGNAETNDELKTLIVRLGSKSEQPEIRDLFEHYLPEDQRVKRLGPTIDTKTLLAQTGSAVRGKQLFETAKDINCRACHQIGSVGKNVGPDLSGIGTQQTPAEILTSILDPSAKIAPEFRARKILMDDGKVVVGIVVKENDVEMTIVDTSGKTQVISTDDVDVMQPSVKSGMPEQLLSGMTSQQAADLLAYLAKQRKIGPRQHKRTAISRATDSITIDGKRSEADWQSAKSVGEFEFTWWNEGDGKRQPTDARMLWDDDFLYLSFRCTDTDIQATRTHRDSEVYRDDCVEVFASPEFDHPERYFNIEMNALATQLDSYRPTGNKREKSWTPDGIRIAVSVDGTINDSSDTDIGWTLEVAIPFKLFAHVLPNGHPKVGDRWRLNLNRLEGDRSVKSQWSQGDRNVPRFHHPEYFGFVEFAD